eukprot:gene6755-14606_t
MGPSPRPGGPRRGRAPAAKFVYVGSDGYGRRAEHRKGTAQGIARAKVEDSPGYGKVKIGEEKRGAAMGRTAGYPVPFLVPLTDGGLPAPRLLARPPHTLHTAPLDSAH